MSTPTPETPAIPGVASAIHEFKDYGPGDYLTLADTAVFLDAHPESVRSMIHRGLLVEGEQPRTITCQSLRWLWQNRTTAGRISRKGRPASWTSPDWEPWCSLNRTRHEGQTRMKASATTMKPLATIVGGLALPAQALGVSEEEIIFKIANREWGICGGLVDLVSPRRNFIVPWVDLVRERSNQTLGMPRKQRLIELEPGDRLLDITEISKALDVARVTVYKWVNQRVFPVHHVGREIRIKRSDLLAYIQKRRASFKSGSFGERLCSEWCKPGWVMPDWL